MTVYYILYIYILIFPAVLRYIPLKKKSLRKIESIGFLVPVILLLGLRHPSMGTDLRYGETFGYLGSYQIIGSLSFKDVLNLKSYLNYEKGYVLLNKLLSYISKDIQFLLFACAMIALIPIARFIYQYSRNQKFSWIVYLGLPCFLINFSGLRQSIAMGLCCLTIPFILNKNRIRFVLCILFASLFHYTALVFLLAYPVYHIQLNYNKRIASVFIPLVVFVLKAPLFMLFSRLIHVNIALESNGALTLFLVFLMIYAYCAVFADYSNDQANGFINIYFLAVICQAFSGVNSLAMRVGYYFMIPLIVGLPDIVLSIKNPSTKLISLFLIETAFFIYGLLSLYGTSWAMTNPYHFFWSLV